jgi:hypothetical protein
MADEPWELLDDVHDLAELTALLWASPTERLLDRLADFRPRWHRRAACRGTGIDFFDPAQADRAVAICRDCPVAAQCREAGRREPAGVWGGQVAGACLDCGVNNGRQLTRARCPACYARHRRRLELKA